MLYTAGSVKGNIWDLLSNLSFVYKTGMSDWFFLLAHIFFLLHYCEVRLSAKLMKHEAICLCSQHGKVYTVVIIQGQPKQ